MKNMKRRNYLLTLLFGLVFVFAFLNIIPVRYIKASAATPQEEAEPNGWFTKLKVSLNGGDGKVWATAKNTFTLFPATVSVYVELYNSTEFKESYKNMMFVGNEFIRDLNMNQEITYTASTGGETLYWQARIYFKIDDRAWDENMTSTVLIDGDGNYIRG